MDKGIYTALSGGIAKGHELELVANNIANATTPGFKRDTGTFNEYLTELRRNDSPEALKREITAATMLDGRPPGDKSFVEMDGVYTDFRQGGLEKTGRKFDLGIEGQGFFEVLTPSGVRYTRQGNFSISKDGVLVTSSGFPVLSAGQGQAPEGRRIQVGEGTIQFTNDGKVFQNGTQVASLSVQEFQETQWLEKVGGAYFRNDRPENLKAGGEATSVHQGFLEGSNVNAVSEMTKLIEVSRSYEAHMQAIKTYQEVDAKTVSEIIRER